MTADPPQAGTRGYAMNGVIYERPGAPDGYDGRVPRGAAQVDELRDRIARDLQLDRLRSQLARAGSPS